MKTGKTGLKWLMFGMFAALLTLWAPKTQAQVPAPMAGQPMEIALAPAGALGLAAEQAAVGSYNDYVYYYNQYTQYYNYYLSTGNYYYLAYSCYYLGYAYYYYWLYYDGSYDLADCYMYYYVAQAYYYYYAYYGDYGSANYYYNYAISAKSGWIEERIPRS